MQPEQLRLAQEVIGEEMLSCIGDLHSGAPPDLSLFFFFFFSQLVRSFLSLLSNDTKFGNDDFCPFQGSIT